mgnify:CR=1 FL=1
MKTSKPIGRPKAATTTRPRLNVPEYPYRTMPPCPTLAVPVAHPSHTAPTSLPHPFRLVKSLLQRDILDPVFNFAVLRSASKAAAPKLEPVSATPKKTFQQTVESISRHDSSPGFLYKENDAFFLHLFSPELPQKKQQTLRDPQNDQETLEAPDQNEPTATENETKTEDEIQPTDIKLELSGKPSLAWVGPKLPELPETTRLLVLLSEDRRHIEFLELNEAKQTCLKLKEVKVEFEPSDLRVGGVGNFLALRKPEGVWEIHFFDITLEPVNPPKLKAGQTSQVNAGTAHSLEFICEVPQAVNEFPLVLVWSQKDQFLTFRKLGLSDPEPVAPPPVQKPGARVDPKAKQPEAPPAQVLILKQAQKQLLADTIKTLKIFERSGAILVSFTPSCFTFFDLNSMSSLHTFTLREDCKFFCMSGRDIVFLTESDEIQQFSPRSEGGYTSSCRQLCTMPLELKTRFSKFLETSGMAATDQQRKKLMILTPSLSLVFYCCETKDFSKKIDLPTQKGSQATLPAKVWATEKMIWIADESKQINQFSF